VDLAPISKRQGGWRLLGNASLIDLMDLRHLVVLRDRLLFRLYHLLPLSLQLHWQQSDGNNTVLKAMYDAVIDTQNAGDSSLTGGVVAIYTGSSLALTEVTRVWIQSGRPGGVLVDVQTRVLLDAVETYAQQFDPGGIIIESVSEYEFYNKSQLSSEC
jgi:hypothetical protein